MSVNILEGLIDLDFGDWEGKSVKEVEQSTPDLFRLWKVSPDKVRFPGGESLKLAKDRAMQALLLVAQSHPKETGVVVSHRVICKLLVLAALGASEAGFWRVQQDLACYNLLEWTGANWIVRLVNETGHLKDVAGHLKQDF
jgi:probable phosphoglycerate mutase